MDRTRVWPDFRAEHILFEDDHLVVVHKPAGVPSQAAQPDRPDDLVTRLRAFLDARGGSRGTYLGVHQRLDRDTSGLLVFTKQPSANAALAEQIEGRSIEKRYLAGVVGWPPDRREATLADDLARGEDGRVEVVSRQKHPKRELKGERRDAKRAVTRVTRRRVVGERALLELVLETGRTHQARVQLAHAGAPIAGDVLYGGTPAPRLMLHASALGLVHPRARSRLAVRDDLDRAIFEGWLARGDLGYAVYDDRDALDRALALAVERRWGLGRSQDRDPLERRTTCFRLVNEEGDALPGLAIDVYGDHLVVQLHASDEWERPARKDRILDAADALGFDGVYLKLRPKQANVLVDTRKDDLAPKLPVRGGEAPGALVVHEEGVPFPVRLGDGLSTGLFLDQRQNRRTVRELARGARVLNLFSYTCAFSVVAALGGAAATVSVDASMAALERGRDGFRAAGVALGREHTFVADDAFSWLARAARKTIEPFDLVILDPPSYSSTKKRRFVAESDYGELVALAAAVTAPRGRIVACCNHRGMGRPKLRRLVHEGARSAGREVLQLKDLPDAPDFPGAGGRDPHMKSLLVTLN